MASNDKFQSLLLVTSLQSEKRSPSFLLRVTDSNHFPSSLLITTVRLAVDDEFKPAKVICCNLVIARSIVNSVFFT